MTLTKGGLLMLSIRDSRSQEKFGLPPFRGDRGVKRKAGVN